MSTIRHLSLAAAGLTLVCAAAVADSPGLTPEELAALFPGIEAENISESPLPGIYEISVGGSVAYVSRNGRYLLRGELIDLETETNLTAQRQDAARAAVIDTLEEATMVVFGPENPTHTITVFTDIDCGYCRRMHREIEQINALGISVRYLFYPRSGPATESWRKADNVWCADDQLDAMTAAKNGEPVPARNCGTTPVEAHYALGGRIGLQGTPAIYTETGEQIGGYLPPEALLARLRASAARRAAR